MNIKLRNFHRDPGSETGGGSVESTASTGAASAQPSEGAAEPAAMGGQSDGGGLAASPDAAQTYDAAFFSSLEERAENGYLATDEELAAYEKWTRDGKPQDAQPGDPSQSNTPAEVEPGASEKDGGKAKAGDSVALAMAEVGAKSPDELPVKLHELRSALSQKGQEVQTLKADHDSMKALVEDLAAGVPEAIAFFQEQFGKVPPVQAKPQAQASAQHAGASPYLFSQEEIDGMLDPSVGKAFNDRIMRMQADMEAKFTPAIEHYKSEAQRIAVERSRALVIDDMVSVAAKFGDVYGNHANMRELVEAFARTGQADPRIAELVETVKYMRDNGLQSLETAHRARDYDRLSGRRAQDVIEAQRKARDGILNVKPSVGLGGKGGVGGEEYSPSQIEAMAQGKMPIPDSWKDRDGLPIPDRLPAQVRKAMFG